MGFVRRLTGKDQAKAAKQAGALGSEAALEAARLQAVAGEEAIGVGQESTQAQQGFFEPFAEVGARGVAESGFLADPNAQFDFLQSNPLFQLALDNANEQTSQRASAGRRLSFGDTLQELSNNVLLSASPLIDRQRGDITSLLNAGIGVAGQQAGIEERGGTRIQDLITGVAAAEGAGQVGSATQIGAGKVGAANARGAGARGILDLAGQVVSFGATPLSAFAPKGSIFGKVAGVF